MKSQQMAYDLAGAAASRQAHSAKLDAIAALVSAAGWLYNDGSGNFSYSTSAVGAHQLDGAQHTVSGLTPGHFLKATGANTFGFTAHGLTYTDVGAAAAAHTHAGVYEPVIAAGAAGEYWAGGKSWATLNQAAVAGLTTASSPAFVTVKCSGLGDGYMPYHVSDAAGLANSKLSSDGTDIFLAGGSRIYLDGGYAVSVAASGAGAGKDFLFYTGGSERMRILTGGSVLIGATAAVGSEKLYVNGPVKSGDTGYYGGKYAFTIADDAAYSFTPDTFIGILCLARNIASYSALIAYRAYSSGNYCQVLAAGAGIAVATGALTGTTGTDGVVTISVHTDGKIYIENRSGSSGNFSLMIIAGYG